MTLISLEPDYGAPIASPALYVFTEQAVETVHPCFNQQWQRCISTSKHPNYAKRLKSDSTSCHSKDFHRIEDFNARRTFFIYFVQLPAKYFLCKIIIHPVKEVQ